MAEKYLDPFEEYKDKFDHSRPFAPFNPSLIDSRPVYSVNIPQKISLETSIDEILNPACLIIPNSDRTLNFLQVDNNDTTFVIKFDENTLNSIDSTRDLAKQILQNAVRIVGLHFSRLVVSKLCADLFFPSIFQCGRLNYLVDLDLSYNSLTKETLKSLCILLDPSKSGICPIKRIILSRCRLISDEMVDLFTSIRENIILEECLINGNSIQDKAISSLSRFLSNPENRLRELAMGHTGLTAQGMAKLAPTFRSHPFLTTLQVQGCEFGDEGMSHLVDVLEKTGSSNIDFPICEEEEELFIEEKESKLDTLNVSCCDIVRCSPWGERDGIGLCTTLVSLDLSYNRIGDEGFCNLSSGLRENCSIRSLDLSHNMYGGPLCICIMDLLVGNKALISINLSGNLLHPKVWEAVRMGLEENNTLLTLDLSSCGVGRDTAVVLARAFEKNETVSILLRDNPLPLALRESLRDNFPREREDSARLNPLLLLRGDVVTKVFENGSAWIESRKSAIFEIMKEKRKPKKIHPPLPLAIQIEPKHLVVPLNKNNRSALDEVFPLTISYGRQSEILGDLFIHESTSYFDLKPMIAPLVRRYFHSSETNNSTLTPNLEFVILDPSGREIPPAESKIRQVLVETKAHHNMITIRPADWIEIPKGPEEDEEY